MYFFVVSDQLVARVVSCHDGRWRCLELRPNALHISVLVFVTSFTWLLFFLPDRIVNFLVGKSIKIHTFCKMHRGLENY